jgi:protein-disulfide isomerase
MTFKLDTATNITVIITCVLTSVTIGTQILTQAAKPQWARSQSKAVEDVHSSITIIPKDHPTTGSASAKVALIEFGDLQCPFCGKYERDTYPQLSHDFVDRGILEYVALHLPLPGHPFAIHAAQAAECALQQGLYWPMRDRLFANQNSLTDADLRNHAKLLNLDVGKFNRCFDGPQIADIQRDASLADKFGIKSTPTFLIAVMQGGGLKPLKRINGAQPYQLFKAALNEVFRREKLEWPSDISAQS